MLNKIYKIILSSVFVLFPVFSFAQLKETGKLFWEAKYIVTDMLVPLAFILALLFFFWGIAKYIRSAGSEKDEGKKVMVWGIVALFVMASVWGLVAFLFHYQQSVCIWQYPRKRKVGLGQKQAGPAFLSQYI